MFLFLPFYLIIHVVTMAESKKVVKVDTKLIFSRAMGLTASSEINLASVFSHELAPRPTSMLEDSGDMRITKSKSVLKQKLSVEQPPQTPHPPPPHHTHYTKFQCHCYRRLCYSFDDPLAFTWYHRRYMNR